MLGDAVLYAASRATHTAIENVSRRAAWTGLAAAFLLCGLVAALVVAYWLAERYVGPFNAAALIAAGCVLVGVVCLSIPSIVERIEAARKQRRSATETTAAVVQDEAKEAVDYFGALQVVGAAFLFGLSAARRLKR
jgi:MFS family permease